MPSFTVLVADDDESQRNIQKLVLAEVSRSLGAEVVIDEARDSVQTRKFLEKKRYDIVVLDNEFKDELSPGHLPGIALLQLMRKGGLNMKSPTIFLTGDPYDSLRPMAEKYSAIYYQKAKADTEEMTQMYIKLLSSQIAEHS